SPSGSRLSVDVSAFAPAVRAAQLGLRAALVEPPLHRLALLGLRGRDADASEQASHHGLVDSRVVVQLNLGAPSLRLGRMAGVVPCGNRQVTLVAGLDRGVP